MSKVYMVEIPDDGNLVESGNCIVFDAPAQNRTLKRMKSGRLLYSQDEVDAMYNNALAKGCAIAWDLVQKIAKSSTEGGFTCGEMADIFGTHYPLAILRNNTYSEAADKVAKWAAQIDQSISSNDVLINDITGKEALAICASGEQVHLLYTDGSSGDVSMRFLKRHYKKTGETLGVLAFICKHDIGGII